MRGPAGGSAGPDPEDQAGEVVRLVRDVLGDDLVGAYLHGSAVLGGLRHESDVDVLAVSRRPTSAAGRRALVDGLLDVSGSRARRGPARPVELTIVVASEVRPWRYPPRVDFLYGEWLRDDCERGMLPAPGPAPDLAPVLTIALRGDRALDGPPPADVLDPVPAEDLRRAIVAGIPGLLADLEPDTGNVLLTLARIWMTLATDEITSKDRAADWALARLPPRHRPVLAGARARYLGEAAGGWAGLLPAARAHAHHVVREIERLAGPAASGA